MPGAPVKRVALDGVEPAFPELGLVAADELAVKPGWSERQSP
jgi:hypothetical protein